MKTYKFLRGLLKASALTTVMFIMQACYGTPNGPYLPEVSEDEEDQVMVSDSDTTFNPEKEAELVSVEFEMVDAGSDGE